MTNLVEHVPPGTPDADAQPRRVREELATPYTFERWRAEITALAEGAETGFDVLASLGMRWHPGKVYAVAARPGGGKTAFLLEAVARYLEAHEDRMAAFLSWEEPLADIVLRLLLRADAKLSNVQASTGAGVAPITLDEARRWGRQQPVGWDIASRLVAAGAIVEQLLQRLRLVDGDEIGSDARAVFADVAAWTREVREETGHPLGLVAVDYFQKLRGDDSRSRQVELQAVANTVRRFAKGFDLTGERETRDDGLAVPVLIGAQVTRGGADHPDGDRVREADDLLNDAAALITLSKESQGAASLFSASDEACTLRLSVFKHRGGGTRPDQFARIPWHPARHWIAPQALRDAGDGNRVRWNAIESPDDPPAKKNGTRRSATIGEGVVE